MRVLIITESIDAMDGWGRYSRDLLDGLTQAGQSVFSAVARSAAAQRTASDQESPSVRVMLETPQSYIYQTRQARRSAQNLQSLIDEWSPDVIHIVVEPYQNLLPFLSLKRATKIVATLHGTYAYTPALFRNPLKRFLAMILYARSARRVNAYIVVSSYTKEKVDGFFLPRFLGVCRRLVTIPNAVRIDKRADAVAMAHPQMTQKNNTLLYVGAVKPRKGLDQIIQALVSYRELFAENQKLIVAGQYDPHGRFFLRIKKMIEQEGLEKDVSFLGRIDDSALQALYKNVGGFIMLPVEIGRTFEGFGLVYLEAAAAGVPCIGSRDSGARDAIKDRATGFLVNPGKPEAVARAIRTIIKEKKIDSKACVEWAEAHALPQMIDRLLELYNQ